LNCPALNKGTEASTSLAEIILQEIYIVYTLNSWKRIISYLYCMDYLFCLWHLIDITLRLNSK